LFVGWTLFAHPVQKGKPGVGMSADAARMSACATFEFNTLSGARKLVTLHPIS
jgi:hypothetical protein